MVDLNFETARELVRLVRTREVAVVEVMEAHLRQIERVNPRLNAIVTLCAERALEAARDADATLARGEPVGPLFGLPIAHKDAVETRGLRTTFGSRVLRNYLPESDALLAERLRGAGAIMLGKTNLPEFGLGSQTYNEVFGETLNPYDTTRTCGGSSGGAAVALACGMVPIADGGDMGGSLRNPASFCNVVGFRPTPGRVPSWPSSSAWQPFAVEGPMARTVADAALLLSAMAGPDPRSPISLQDPGERFAAPLERDFSGVRIAWSRDLGGLPVDRRVTEVIESARPTFEALGCEIVDAEPDLDGADEIFEIYRAWLLELSLGRLLDLARDQFKETAAWNIEQGRKLAGPDLGRAEVLRTALFHRVREFMENHAFLIAPVSQVPPFDVNERWVRSIENVKMDTYLDWMKSSSRITVTGLPAISVPCGFTPDGLPVGVQIIGPSRDDFGVLQLAHAFETATGHGRRLPPVVAN